MCAPIDSFAALVDSAPGFMTLTQFVTHKFVISLENACAVLCVPLFTLAKQLEIGFQISSLLSLQYYIATYLKFSCYCIHI